MDWDDSSIVDNVRAMRPHQGGKRLLRIQYYVDQFSALDKNDPEAAHAVADELLCEALEEFGLEEIALARQRAEHRIGFRYWG